MAATEEKKEAASENEVEKKSVAKKNATSKKAAVVIAEHADVAYRVLIEPWITEKTHSAMAMNKYTFKVTSSATKKQVKQAIEGMYKVVIEKVSVVNIHAKKKAYGRYEGKKSGFKKATVTLKEGGKIELFQGA